MKRSPNRVRIVGGLWRGRLLAFPDGPGVRPTPDRVRETVFNWLGQDLTGLRCLDLFAGSGALGFEAASRGAAHVVIVERSRPVVAALRESAARLGATQCEVLHRDALEFLAATGERFDVVFIDPPYEADLLVRALEAVGPRLAPDARVYAEGPALAPGTAWRIVREGRAGAVRFALLERGKDEAGDLPGHV